ncbi:LytR/AlgR family response regulator transcription factor [Sphingomonas cavernae]|nr:LytTR family DNA-binding domain-containing protein [Sphingomonas cavernae]
MADLRVLAVDDEPLALRRLEIALGQMRGIQMVGTARSGRQALEQIAAHRPDVMLLDIKMAGMGGFEVIEALDDRNMPLVIFVTAFNAFAPRAFEVSAVDYILKPVEFDRLQAALDKARQRIAAVDARQRAQELQAVVAALRAQADEASAPQRYESEIWAQRRGEFVRVLVRDIEWVEADRDYVHVHACGQSYMLRETIGGFQERLDPDAFIRVRRSALVRKDCVVAVRLEGYGHFRARLASGAEIRVGRTYTKVMRALLRHRHDAQHDSRGLPDLPDAAGAHDRLTDNSALN